MTLRNVMWLLATKAAALWLLWALFFSGASSAGAGAASTGNQLMGEVPVIGAGNHD